jgi:1-deoxy-D-xylulose-5-phosphate reductoisomerase
LNAAEEMSFHAFCAGRIGFLAMADVVEQVMDAMVDHTAAMAMDDVFAADAEARRRAGQVIAQKEMAA